VDKQVRVHKLSSPLDCLLASFPKWISKVVNEKKLFFYLLWAFTLSHYWRIFTISVSWSKSTDTRNSPFLHQGDFHGSSRIPRPSKYDGDQVGIPFWTAAFNPAYYGRIAFLVYRIEINCSHIISSVDTLDCVLHMTPFVSYFVPITIPTLNRLPAFGVTASHSSYDWRVCPAIDSVKIQCWYT